MLIFATCRHHDDIRCLHSLATGVHLLIQHSTMELGVYLTCSDRTTLLEWDCWCLPPDDWFRASCCSCAICPFRPLMSCLIMYVSSCISDCLLSNSDFFLHTVIEYRILHIPSGNLSGNNPVTIISLRK